ncbi:MAG: winged helix-turn-helix domain-containing protein [Candidatus Eremiobacteraeota bacterium]|nr:winged helix-turn-helix domain-containing protein [Candidatus Eremiobacteraeota bacterium]
MELPLTRQELAEWTGTSTETVIRLCSDWKRRALLLWDRHTLTLMNDQSIVWPTDLNHISRTDRPIE